AEDGIRDDLVTGVQTCALPICSRGLRIFCFHVEASGQKLPVATQHELLEQLTAWGFPVEAHHALVPDLAHANTEITKLETLLPKIGRASCRERGREEGSDATTR